MEQFDDGGIGDVESRLDRDIFWCQLMDVCTTSEVIVLALTLMGWDVGDIADHMEVSASTVNTHLSNIKAKGRDLAETDEIVLY